MLGSPDFRIVWPETHAPAAAHDEGIEMKEYDFDAQLYSRLKDVRNRLAKQEGVPPYLIFPNKTLEFFTRLRPKSLEAGMRIKGVGEVKAGKYLQAFIDEVARR